MRFVPSKVCATALLAVCALVSSPSFADSADECAAAIQRAAGTHAKCLLNADAERSLSGDAEGYRTAVARCIEVFERSHQRTLSRFGADSCPDGSAQSLMDTVLHSTASINLAASSEPAPLASMQLGSVQGGEADSAALLEEVTAFTGQIMFIQYGVPGLIIAAVRGEDSAVFGFGETAKGSGVEPDGNSIIQIGSITKVFVGEVMARLVADHTIGFSDPLADYLDLGVPLPTVDGRDIRLIDLVTQSGGLPRELPPDDQPPSRESFAHWFESNDLLFKPGSGALYSNFGYELLGSGLEDAAEHSLAGLVQDFITGPLDMSDTTYDPSAAQLERAMQGYNFDGQPFPSQPEPPAARGASGLYATADDLVRWMRWHLDRFTAEDAEVRLLDHATYLQRDGLNPVSGMDESGHMDAVGLGWVVMMPENDRPFILQKAGGTNGFFAYLALAPTRDVAAFVVINEYDFSAAVAMAATINEMIATLAPR